MKQLLLVSVLFFVFSSYVSAQASCGSIVALVNNYEENSPIEIRDIVDCDNPFQINAANYPYQYFVNEVAVSPDSPLIIGSEGTRSHYPYFSRFYYEVNLYLHTPGGFEEMSLRFIRPNEEQITNYVTAFTKGDMTYYDELWWFINTTYNFVPYPDDMDLDEYPDEFWDNYALPLLYDYVEEVHNFYYPLYPGVYTVVAEYEGIRQSMTFTLVAEEVEDDNVVTGASSILFLPGIKASRLYTKNWLGFEDRLWTPNNNGDIRQLSMSETGDSLTPVYTRDIIDNVLGLGSVYGEIGNFLDGLVVEEKIRNWQPFAYDWRYAVDDIVTDGTQYEHERRYVLDLVEELAADSFSGQVTIIAHSNGGLLAKALLTELTTRNKAHLVDSLILLASPQLGTPKAIGTILHGYGEEILYGLLVSADTARATTLNMPSVYSLLPTDEYFAATFAAPVILFSDDLPVDFASYYGTNITDSATLDDFVTARRDSRDQAVSVYEVAVGNQSLLEKTRNLHGDVLQPWRAPAHMSVIEVAGIGLPTIHSFVYRSYKKLECPFSTLLQPCALVDKYKPVPRFSLLGDETVMTVSAAGYQGEKGTYYLNLGDIKGQLPRIKHHNFTEFNDVQSLITNILLDEFQETPFITKDISLDSDSYVLLGVHSPVMPTVRATDGTVATVRFSGDFVEIIEDIVGSRVYYFGDTTYIVLPAEAAYDITLEGTGTGVVTLEVDYIAADIDQRLEQRLFIPEVATSSLVRTRLVSSVFEDVLVDVNNDGFFDYLIDAVTNEQISLKDDEIDSGVDGGTGPLAKRKSPTAISPSLPLPPVAAVATGSGVTMDIQQISILLGELKKVLEAYEKSTRK